MSLISAGSSRAICSVGSWLISSSEARSISRTSHALASSSLDRSRRASGPEMGHSGAMLTPPSADLGPRSRIPAHIARKTSGTDASSCAKIPAVSELIPIEEARRRVLDAVRPLGVEAVELDAALGRVLARDVRSPIDVPPFDNSAMDGYAVIAGPEAELELIGESRAGRPAAEARAGRRRHPRVHRGRAAGRAPTPWCPSSAPRRTARACAWVAPSRATTCAAPARTCAPATPCCAPRSRSARPSSAWPPRWAVRAWSARCGRGWPCW